MAAAPKKLIFQNPSNFRPPRVLQFSTHNKKKSFSKFLYIKGQLLRKARRGAHIYVRDSLSFQKVVFFDDLGLKFLKKKLPLFSLFNWQFKKILCIM